MPLHDTLACPENPEFRTVGDRGTADAACEKLRFAGRLVPDTQRTNGGIRPARGRFIASSATDFLIPDELMSFNAAEQREAQSLALFGNPTSKRDLLASRALASAGPAHCLK